MPAPGYFPENRQLNTKLYKQALSITEQLFGPEHLETASFLTGLGALYNSQGKYTQAELLYQRALQIQEHHLGPEHPDLAYLLSGLAALKLSRASILKRSHSFSAPYSSKNAV